MDHNETVFANRQESVTADDDGGGDTKMTDRAGASCSGCGGGSIAERRAATCGFKAERIHTARFRLFKSPLGWPSARSPYLTISPGISPTALLESPILLHNDQVSSSLNFVQGADVDQPLVHLESPLDFEFPAEISKEVTSMSSAADSVSDLKVLNSIGNDNANFGFHPSELASDQTSMKKEPLHGQYVNTNLLEGDQKGTNTAMGTARTSEDGYNWRKYGQKQVKGSEYPRSYYKCTHPNCHVKKKVERSLDGQITEIIYTGAHNHPKPQPARRPSVGSTLTPEEMSDIAEESGISVKVEGGSIWRNAQAGSKDSKLGSDLRADGLERTSSTSVITDISDPLSTAQGKSIGAFESDETPEFSSTLASHDGDNDDDDDRATQGSISLCDDSGNDERERRKKDSSLTEMNVASGTLREPRVVVQIESDVDILDDGYRWRKYGQKVVKGNPNPRSYYKCTTPGCPVRKHIERASHNLKCVLTTYDGKHNHEVPAARNNSHAQHSSVSNLPPTMLSTQAALGLARNTHALKREIPIQDIAPPFDRKYEFKNEYLRPSLLGDFSNEIKLGTASLASVYQMNFPSIQNKIPCGSFGLNPNCIAAHPSGSIASTVPNFPMSLPLSLPISANRSLAGFYINNGEKSAGQTHSFLRRQQCKENGTRFLGIKQEQTDENLYDPCLPIVNHVSSTSASSIYPQANGKFPS